MALAKALRAEPLEAVALETALESQRLWASASVQSAVDRKLRSMHDADDALRKVLAYPSAKLRKATAAKRKDAPTPGASGDDGGAPPPEEAARPPHPAPLCAARTPETARPTEASRRTP